MKYSQHIIFFTGDFVYIIAQGILPGKSVPSRSPEFSKHCQLLKADPRVEGFFQNESHY